MRKLLIPLYIFVIVAVIFNHQAIADWWFLQSYNPDPQVSALADKAQLSPVGRRYFYVSDPQINDKQEFNVNCPVQEKALVLGCYSGRHIYILEINRPELEGVMEVTAAHEMLHAAYDRLSNRERERINEQLLEAYSGIDKPKLRELISSYEESGGREVMLNELHSILPTQVMSLPDGLEEYFGQYFDDRGQLVRLYQEYESVFLDINRRIDGLKAQIDDLRSQIDTQEAYISQLRSELESVNNSMRNHRQADENEQYNNLVPRQNTLVDNYNGAVRNHRDMINRHNQLVNEVNDLVILQNDLVKSMDSRYDTL